MYRAPSADPALRVEERGGATGLGGKREGIGEEEEEEEEEDEGPKGGLFLADRRAIAVCAGPEVRGGVKTAPRYLYSAPSADPALCLEGRGGGNGDWLQEGGARGEGRGKKKRQRALQNPRTFL